jgi:hypothetical protein
VSVLPPPITPPPTIFTPPPPVLVPVIDGHGHHGEVELELNYGDTIDGRGTLNSLKHADDIAPIIQASVPEPASWAMMLVGFGGLGALLRRRRSLAASSAA